MITAQVSLRVGATLVLAATCALATGLTPRGTPLMARAQVAPPAVSPAWGRASSALPPR